MKYLNFLPLVLAASTVALTSASHAQSTLERIATAVLAEKFGIDISQITQLRTQTKLPVYELAPIYEGAHYFNRSPSTVWQLRNEGLGWGQIAQRVHMNPGKFNKLRKQGAFDRDQFWKTTYQNRFGVPAQRMEVLRREGGTLEDVLGAIVVGKLSKKDPVTVFNQYKTQRSWTTITQSQSVRLEDWRRVSAPVRSKLAIPKTMATIKPKVNKGVRDHAEGIGNGKSKGQSKMSHGKGRSQRKLAGNGKVGGANQKGHGNRGNGKGNGHGKDGEGHGKGKGG